MSVNIREIVFDSLLECEERGAKSHLLIRDVLSKYDYLDERDKNFIKRLFEGTIQTKITLDHFLDKFSKTPMAKCKPAVRTILRMGAYQIMYMDRVPDSAACDEAVKLCKKRSRQEFAGFVNAVLKKLAADKARITDFDDIEDPVMRMSVKYSIPAPITAMLYKEVIGKDTERADNFFKALTSERNTVVRITSGDVENDIVKKWDAGIKYVKSAVIDRAYEISGYGSAEEIPGFTEGFVYIQDLSSMIAVSEAVKALKTPPAGKDDMCNILDLCAAPGGKSIYAVELLGKNAHVIACDVSDNKAALIEENIKRLNISDMECKVCDATIPNEDFIGRFDLVIADVPCSGLGVISKKSDIKYKITNEAMKDICDLQKRIADNAVRYVKPGGVLMYSTCTVHKAENEKMASYILKNGGFTLVSSKQLLPDTDGTDGFYYAVFVKGKDITGEKED